MNRQPILLNINSNSLFYESFMQIRLTIDYLIEKQNKKFLLVTSAVEGEGKSLITANLGASFALENKKVLIIDGNLRSPKQHELFKINGEIGLVQCLSHQSPFENAIYETVFPNLSVMISGGSYSNPSEIFLEYQIKKLKMDLINQFDLILFDTPASDRYSEAKVAATSSDGVILVVQYKKAKARVIKKVLAQFKQIDVDIVGSVLNKSS